MSTAPAEIQKIVVSLSETEIQLDTDSIVQIMVTMVNQQEEPDRLLLEIEGVDVEWYGIPVPAVNVDAREETQERILFKVARNSENRAGTYPFLVRVRAMETGAIGVAQGTLTVKAFDSLQAELAPKRGVTTFVQPIYEYEVSLTNEGNHESNFDLYASDAEDECIYEFEQERVTLKPGQSIQSPLLVRAKDRALVGGARLYAFSVFARSTTPPYAAATMHGQLEQRTLFSPVAMILALLLLITGVATWQFWPRPAPPLLIHKFLSLPNAVVAGKPVTLSWDVTPSYKQILLFRQDNDLQEVAETAQPNSAVGSVKVYPQAKKTVYALVLRGTNGQDKREEVTITVTQPPTPPKPVINSFSAEPTKLHEGEVAVLSWDAKNADKQILDPGNNSLQPYVQSYQVTPDKDTTYTLRVVGRDAKQFVEKTVTVRVVSKEVCLAEIVDFRPEKKTVYIGDKVRLVWSTRYARSARLDYDKGALGEVSRSGKLEIPTPLLEPTTFLLTAIDSAGKTITKQITVTPQQPPPPVEPSPTEDPNTENKEGTEGQNPPKNPETPSPN